MNLIEWPILIIILHTDFYKNQSFKKKRYNP